MLIKKRGGGVNDMGIGNLHHMTIATTLAKDLQISSV